MTRLHQTVLRSGLSQKTIARLSGINSNVLAETMYQRSHMNVKHAIQLAAFFEEDVDWLFGDLDDKTRRDNKAQWLLTTRARKADRVSQVSDSGDDVRS